MKLMFYISVFILERLNCRLLTIEVENGCILDVTSKR